MLILTRKQGEAIAIGDNIQIQVLNVKRGQVRIGISAPREVKVDREECLDESRKSEPQVAVEPSATEL